MIHYVFGDAAYPDVSQGGVFLAHVCNDVGKWGAGFTRAVEHRWPGSGARWKRVVEGWGDRQLGQIHFDPTNADRDAVVLANMVAQHDVGTAQIRLDYPALRKCLRMLAVVASADFDRGGGMVPVHMPRIGCGLAGGRWELVEPIIQETLVRAGVEVVVYDLPIPKFMELPGISIRVSP